MEGRTINQAAFYRVGGGGPVNLLDEEWALGQMTHPQCSINTAVQGRRGDCYCWPRNPETLGFLSPAEGL